MPVYTLKSVYTYRRNDDSGDYDDGPLPVTGAVTVDTSSFTGYQYWGLFQSSGGDASKTAGNARFVDEGWNQYLDDVQADFNLDPEFDSWDYEYTSTWNPLIFVGLIGATANDPPSLALSIGDGALSVYWSYGADSSAPVQVFVAWGSYAPEGGDTPVDPPAPVCFWTNLVNAKQDCEAAPAPDPDAGGGTFEDPYDLGYVADPAVLKELGPLSAGQVQWLKFSHSFELSGDVAVDYSRADWDTPERIIFVFNSSGTPQVHENAGGGDDGSKGFFGTIPFGSYMIAVAPLGSTASAPFNVTTPPGVTAPSTTLSALMRV